MGKEETVPQNVRAFIAVKRQRWGGGSYPQTDERLEEVVNCPDENYTMYGVITVYGGVDHVIPVDATSRHHLHKAVTAIGSVVGATRTFIAASLNGGADLNSLDAKNTGVIALDVQADAHEPILKIVRARKEIIAADIVFGEFDIMMLYDTKYPPRNIIETLLKDPRCSAITKTSTFLPYRDF